MVTFLLVFPLPRPEKTNDQLHRSLQDMVQRVSGHLFQYMELVSG